MAYSVIIKAVKPANKSWWGPQTANRSKMAAIRSQTNATTGLISSTAGQSATDPNTWVTHQLWDTKAHYDAYAAALATNAHYQERNAYGETNGFVVTRYEAEVTLS